MSLEIPILKESEMPRFQNQKSASNPFSASHSFIRLFGGFCCGSDTVLGTRRAETHDAQLLSLGISWFCEGRMIQSQHEAHSSSTGNTDKARKPHRKGGVWALEGQIGVGSTEKDRTHFSPIRMAKNRKDWHHQMLVRMWSNWNAHVIGESVNGSTASKNSIL